MRASSGIFTLAGFSTLRFAVTYPVRDNFHLTRQANDCTDSRFDFDSSCWSTLNLNTYLTNWNTTTCVRDGDPTCCQSNELWSSCFIRLGTNGTDHDDCSQVANGICASEPGYNPNIAPAVRYIIHNIYFLNAFFNNWYNALPIATLDTLLENQPLINEIDPDQKTNFILSDILTALSAGLAFIGAPEVAPELKATLGTASNALLNGIKQAPGVAKAIWPSGTTDSQSIQLGHLDSDLNEIYQNFTQQIDDTLFLLMSDVPSFIAFVSTGAFSGQAKLSLPSDANITGIALRTFVLSTAMTSNNWYADLQFNGKTKEQITQIQLERGGANCTFGPNNICTDTDHSINIWYSDATSRAYQLQVNRKPDASGPSPFQLMTDVLSNEWATLEVLFDGSYNCTAAGNAGQRLNFTMDGTVDFSCVSQLENCVERGYACPVTEIDGNCPFGICTHFS